MKPSKKPTSGKGYVAYDNKNARVSKDRSILKESITQSTGGGVPWTGKKDDNKDVAGLTPFYMNKKKFGEKHAEHTIGNVRRERGDETMQPRDEEGHFENLSLVGKTPIYKERGHGNGNIMKRLLKSLSSRETQIKINEYMKSIENKKTQIKELQKEINAFVDRSKSASEQSSAVKSQRKQLENLKNEKNITIAEMNEVYEEAKTDFVNSLKNSPISGSDDGNIFSKYITEHFGGTSVGAQAKLGGSIQSFSTGKTLDKKTRGIMNKYGTEKGTHRGGIKVVGQWANDSVNTKKANLTHNIILKSITMHNMRASKLKNPTNEEARKLTPSFTNASGLNKIDIDKTIKKGNL